MRSTFMGLETNKRGMFTQQSGLYTVGHNISNANTLGYSRQRVNMETTTPYPGIGLNSGTTPGFIGTGVHASSIQRIRDVFVDRQFRQESNNLGYWESRSGAISQIEDIVTEPSSHGLNESMNQFWKSLQDLSDSPESSAARRVVVERGVAVAESFNYLHKQLTEIQSNLKNEINVSTDRVNSIFKQIAELNDQIKKIEPNGYMPNDLYDSRDMLLDELSTYFPIEVEYEKSGGNALAIAEGSVTVRIKTNGQSIEVINGKDFAKMSSNLSKDKAYEDFTEFVFTGTANVTGGTVDYSGLVKGKGKMLSLIDSYGYGSDQGVYPEMLKNLKDMATSFANDFNAAHRNGYEFNSANQAGDFFDLTNIGPDELLKVHNDIINDPNKIGASDRPNEEGNGKNSLLLAERQTAQINIGGTTTTIQTFYQSMIGKLGVDGQQANKMAFNSATLQLSVENRRASISSVSLDEEMTDMIKFQQAYNASARMITVVDETLDRIINGMGRVGQ